MADNSYALEIRIVSKNGYHTPAEAKAYYGKYSRAGITWHWWGDGGKGTHDATANYIAAKAQAGTGSVNYVLSDNKISLLVNPDNVAWCSQAGNPISVSVELQTYLGAEGYKKAGWLADQLRQRYGHEMEFYPHSKWFSTACPGSIDLNRIREEEIKWRNGTYDYVAPPVVTPPVTPPVVTPAKPEMVFTPFTDGIRKYKVNKKTYLYTVDKNAWAEITSGKEYNLGEELDIAGTLLNKSLNATYLITQYSLDKKNPTGFSQADLDRVVPPVVVPDPPVTDPEEPEIVPPVVTPPVNTDKDKEQDERLNFIESIIKKITEFLSSIFSGFKK